MSIYSIKQLELISGVKAHTIRIWEKRYNLFTPVRTDTNIRKYNDTDVRLILNIALLLRKGYRISKVASKSIEEISKLTLEQNPKESFVEKNSIEPLILATISYNTIDFKAFIYHKIKEYGLAETYESTILPFLVRIGLLWQAGAIQTTHEHFASNLIKQIITSSYESLKESKNNSPVVIFFLPEGEFHELGLLFYAHEVKQMGYRTIYFGQSTPTEDLIKSAKELKSKIIFTSFSTKISAINLKELVKNIQKDITDVNILMTGYILNHEIDSIPKGVKVVSSVDSLKKFIKKTSTK
ncbi:MAG: MerR family transcriptional regulator [Tenuifilaceae bacterium]